MSKSKTPDNPTRNWSIESDEIVYDGFYKIEKIKFKHDLFNGGQSETVDREQFVRGDVVAVIAHDPKLDKVALVEQFRIGARHRPSHPWLIEVIAGMVEAGEKPHDVAVREAYEEAGIRLENVQEVMRYLASPGSMSEEVYLYYAHADLSNAGGVFGLESETEDILLHVVDADEAIAMFENGTICNALSIVAMQWFRHHRLQNA